MRRLTTWAAAILIGAATILSGATPAHAATTYFYAVGEQTGLSADGAAVNLTVESPFVTGTSAHSVAELVVRSSDLQQRVEVGWRKAVSGGPKLFVYHAVNGVGMGYNNCVDYAPEPVNVGADLTSWVGAASSPRFQITATSTAWWVAFNAKWVCYIPKTVWTGASPAATFDKAGVVQAYGEVVSTTTATPRTDMGNGQFASSGTAARVGSYALVGSAVPAGFSSVYTTPATAAYTVSVVTPGVTFRYGGAGWSAAGTLPGVIGS